MLLADIERDYRGGLAEHGEVDRGYDLRERRPQRTGVGPTYAHKLADSEALQLESETHV